MKTVETTLFNFAELSETAQDVAFANWQENALSYEWFDSVFEDAKHIGGLLGITDMEIFFSGFYSQGDGACFTGYYNYAKGAPKEVKNYAPIDGELLAIAQRLQQAQGRYFYGLSATLTHAGRYYHENSITFNVEDTGKPYGEVSESAENEITEALQDFMCWIYRTLEKESDYMTSKEVFLESCAANEDVFTENGTRY